MPINFPSNPANNQTYSYGGQNWYWANNYGVWQANTSVVGYTGSVGIITSNTAPTNTNIFWYDTTSDGQSGYTGSAGSGGFSNGQSIAVANLVVNTSITANTAGFMVLPVGNTGQRQAAINGSIRFNTDLGYIEWYSEALGSWLAVYSPSALSVEYLVVAGGGGGGAGCCGACGDAGGGGAGGYLTGTINLNLSASYPITVGSGGTGASQPSQLAGSNGANSSISASVVAIGGGGGGGRGTPGGGSTYIGQNGGSGGGSGQKDVGNPASGYFGLGTAGQGNDGGNGFISADPHGGGGGGGAGAVGGDAPSVATGGAGGAGLYSSISGSNTAYAGGGGGGGSTTVGAGGVGGGGAGSNGSVAPGNGTTNTGGGGGGGGGSNYNGGNGGSGIVIIRYQSTFQRATGGTVTSSAGYYIHTFTSSGTFVT